MSEENQRWWQLQRRALIHSLSLEQERFDNIVFCPKLIHQHVEQVFFELARLVTQILISFRFQTLFAWQLQLTTDACVIEMRKKPGVTRKRFFPLQSQISTANARSSTSQTDPRASYASPRLQVLLSD